MLRAYQTLEELGQEVVAYFEGRKQDYPNFRASMLTQDQAYVDPLNGGALILDAEGKPVPMLTMAVNGDSGMPAPECTKGVSLSIVASHVAEIEFKDDAARLVPPLLHLHPIRETYCVKQLREADDLRKQLHWIFRSQRAEKK